MHPELCRVTTTRADVRRFLVEPLIDNGAAHPVLLAKAFPVVGTRPKSVHGQLIGLIQKDASCYIPLFLL